MSDAVSRSSVSDRPTTVTAAAIALFVLSVGNIGLSLVSRGEDDVPRLVVYSVIVLGVAGLFAAAGLWRCQKWAMIAAIVIGVLNFITSAPGIPFGPSTLAVISSIETVALSIAIIVLVLRSSARASFK